MSSPVVHFEIGSKDTAATAEFYSSVFGWQTADTGSARLITGGHEGGPTGMLNALGHPPENYVLIYIRVDDIDAALTRVTDAGGKKLVGPIPLPDGRRFAWIEDTAGNTLGLLTPEAAPA
jgi:predicted enzyme related to lactoylglutathione lyase